MGLREAARRSTVTDWLLAGFTFVLAVVAIYQFVVMSGQLAVMRDQVKVQRRDQRPWIKVQFKNHPLKPYSNDIGEVSFTNIGKTPALRIEVQHVNEFLSPDQSPTLDLTGLISHVSTGTLFPGSGDEHKDTVQHSIGGKVGDFLPEEIDDYNSGKKYIVFYARVTYTDSTGADYWTQYCEFQSGIGGVMTPTKKCTDYNSTDQQ